MGPDIGHLGGVVVLELLGVPIGALGLGEGDITIGGKAAVVVAGGHFQAVHIALFVIELRLDDGGAELAGVDLILGFLVVSINADVEIRADLLGRADIEVIAAFRADGIIQGAVELVGGVIRGRDIALGDGLEGRRGEIFGVAGMQGGAARGLEGKVGSRTQLILVVELVNNIEPPAIICRVRAGRIFHSSCK